MHEGKFYQNGRTCTIYDTIDEVQNVVGYPPPKYCHRDATELQYGSFFDSLDRFTVNAYCPKCHDKWGICISPEKYDHRMLEHWAERVKYRDGNRCRMADERCSGLLHAHHMIPKAADPSKKYDITNGITLCEFHHKQIHRFM